MLYTNYIGPEQLLCAFTVIINYVKPKHALIKAFHGMRLKFGELILRATIQGVSACIQWTGVLNGVCNGVLNWSAGMEHWTGVLD